MNLRPLNRRVLTTRSLVSTLVAILSISSASAVTMVLAEEDFDSMGVSGTSLPAGWTAGYLGAESSQNRVLFTPAYAANGLAITNMPIIVSDASALPAPNVGTVMNLGITGDGDRALGGYPRTTPSGDHAYQLAIINMTGEDLSEITLTYAGEQWNQAQGTSSSGPEMLRVLISTQSPDDFFTYYPELDFTAPNQGPGATNPTALNGNDPANRVVVSATISLPTTVSDGDSIYIRWHDWNDNGTTDHFLGIDDIMVTAESAMVPEPGAITLLSIALGGAALRRRR